MRVPSNGDVFQDRALGSFTFKSSRIGSPIPISVIHLSLDQPTLHSRVQFPPESKGQERPGRVHVQSARPDCGGARFVKAAGRRSSAWSCASRVPPSPPVRQRSEERRVGKKWGSTCREQG